MKATNNFTMPAWLVHLLGILAALIIYYTSDQDFMKLLSPTLQAAIHPLVAFLVGYVGITQVTKTPTQEDVKK